MAHSVCEFSRWCLMKRCGDSHTSLSHTVCSNLLQPPPPSTHPSIPLQGSCTPLMVAALHPPAAGMPPMYPLPLALSRSSAIAGHLEPSTAMLVKQCHGSLTSPCCSKTCFLLCQSFPPSLPPSCPARLRGSRHSMMGRMWLHPACTTTACSCQCQFSSHNPHTHARALAHTHQILPWSYFTGQDCSTQQSKLILEY